MSKQVPEQETPARKPISLYKQLPLANERIPPPASLFVTRDEALLVRIWNSAASPVVHFYGRLLLPNGDIREIYRRIVPNTDRSVLTTTIGLEDGFLLSCALAADMTTFRGQTWCKVALVRPPQAYQQSAMLLIAEYLTTSEAIGWPGGLLRSSLDGPGYLRSFTGTDPAAAAEISEAVPTNARWKLHTMWFQLVTDGTGTPQVHLVLDDGTSIYCRSPSPSTQAISVTNTYVSGPGILGVAVTDTVHRIGLPADVVQPQVHRIRTLTTNLAGTDNFGAPQLLVEEWIEE